MIKKTPATPLPWHLGVKQAEQIVYDAKGWAVANATVYHGKSDKAETKANAAYIAHAANAYPRLVAAVRALAGQRVSATDKIIFLQMLAELGEES